MQTSRYDSRELVAAARPKKPGKRVCLMCGVAFQSEGIHERICGVCKESDEWNGNWGPEGLDVMSRPNRYGRKRSE